MTEKKKPLREKTDKHLPVSLYHMELDAHLGGISAVVSGVIGIVEMSDDIIKVMTRMGSISISGSKLNISVFEYKTLQISGKIENISFSKNDRRKGKRSREIR